MIHIVCIFQKPKTKQSASKGTDFTKQMIIALYKRINNGLENQNNDDNLEWFGNQQVHSA